MKNKEIVLKDQESVSVHAGKDARFKLQMIEGRLNVTFEGDLVYNIAGKLEFNIKDGFDIVTPKNVCLDNIGPVEESKFYINSKMASQIKDLPESIEYRRKKQELIERMQAATAHLMEEKHFAEMTDEEKVDFVENFEPIKINSDDCGLGCLINSEGDSCTFGLLLISEVWSVASPGSLNSSKDSTINDLSIIFRSLAKPVNIA